MKYDPDRHHRRSIRLKGYDYSRAGAYFVTINVARRECLLGEVRGGLVDLSVFGKAVEEVWHDLPNHYPNLELDAFVVMPNHVHAVFILTNVGPDVGPGLRPGLEAHQAHQLGDPERPGQRPGPTKGRRKPLNEMVGSLKSYSARKINRVRGLTGVPVWQEDYHERIIRDERELDAKREYIALNPLNWATDEENPRR